jgi:hypothetical protein
MHEIICPHCRKAFKVDETGYADILKQVRDDEFDQQLRERLALADQEKLNAIELATTKVASELQQSAAAKDALRESPRCPAPDYQSAVPAPASASRTSIRTNANRNADWRPDSSPSRKISGLSGPRGPCPWFESRSESQIHKAWQRCKALFISAQSC